MMQVIKSARIMQADGMRFSNCVHDVSFLKLIKNELQIYNLVIINITI